MDEKRKRKNNYENFKQKPDSDVQEVTKKSERD
jgi:hypothetical protein